MRYTVMVMKTCAVVMDNEVRCVAEVCADEEAATRAARTLNERHGRMS